MTKTRTNRLNRMIAMLLMLIMVCSLLPTTVIADNTSQNVPFDGFYTNEVTTYLDELGAVTNDTYVNNAPKPTNVRQSTSTTSATDFAAGLPLSTIFIDTSKIGYGGSPAVKGIYTLLATDPSIAGGIVLDGEPLEAGAPREGVSVGYDPTRTVTDDEGMPVDLIQAASGVITKLDGDLFCVVFEDAAILPDGARANLKITYSNARIAVDQRLGELDDSNYQGEIGLARGASVSHYGTDSRDLSTMTQSDAMQEAVNDVASQYGTTFENKDRKYSVFGKALDATYQIVDDDGFPVDGTFIFAVAGINLDRDPYVEKGNTVSKPLWYYETIDNNEDDNPDYPGYHFFSESMSINGGMASDYIYVRPNSDQIENSSDNRDKAHYYPQIILDNGHVRFIGNASSSTSAADDTYSSGFVVLADATKGFTVTAIGHAVINNTMNTNAFSAAQIWYRYTSSTGPNGNIQTTSEGNFGGGLNDASDVGKSANILDPGTYVVPEGKTVTYTMTPNPEHHISKLQVRNENGDMQEIRFNGKPLYTMVEGNTVQFRDATGQLCTLTALADGKFKLEMPYALHDEEVHVQWERTIATVIVKKETEDNKSGSFPFEIKAWKIEEVPIYTPEEVGSIFYQDGDFWLEYSNGEATPDTDGLAAIVSGIHLTDRIEISGGKYLWKTDKKLSDLGLSASGEGGDLFVDFLNAPSAVIGDTLDNTLNTEHERISFYRLNSTTEEVTTYWNFAEGEGQATNPGSYGFSLSNGEEKTFDIPQKYEYEVCEETPAGWELVSIDGTEDASSATGLLSEENYAPKHTFLNRQLPCGDLIVTKTLVGNDTDRSKEFSFTITLDDTTINGEYSGVSFTEGTATITLKGGESKTIEGLPNGVGYKVTEADYSADGYVTTKTGDTGTIDEHSPAVAAFTNTRNTYGGLVVTKTVEGNTPIADAEFSFTVTLSDKTINDTYGDMTFTDGVATFTLKDGESKKATSLPNGITYEVTEADYTADGYVTTKTGATGTIVGNDEVTAAFTNTRNADGSLTISKTLAGNDTDGSKDFTFTITLDDTTISGEYSGVTFTNGVATITLKGGESKTIEGLPNGTGYEVTEADYSDDGYITTKAGDTGTIDENAPMVASFTNTRDTFGDLVVTKTVAGNAASTTKEFSFTVTLSDKTISGTYGDITFENGVATFTLKHDESKTASGLPNGITYEVTEDNYSNDGYVTTKADDAGTITGGETATAEFTNTRNAEGSLTVTKALAGNDTDSTKEFSFTITFSDTTINGEYSDVTFTDGIATITLKGGESKTIEGLPNGTEYAVIEDDYSSEGYVTAKDGDTGTIDENTPTVAAFTNTRDTYGGLVVTKTVEGNAPTADKDFSFTVTLSDTTITGTYGDMIFTNGVATFSLKGGESKTATGLPNGISYAVTEEDYTSEGYVTTKTGDSGIIAGGETATAEFTNTRNAGGSLTISKQLAGNDTDGTKDFTFTITLDDTTINGEYSGVTFTDGIAKITLKGGESKIIEGLPNGTGYEVTEADYTADGYVTTKTGDTGNIDENTPAVAAFTNTRNAYGGLVVTKTVKGNAASTTKEFSFTVTLSDTSITGTYGDMSFADGVATFTLKDGESVTATNLPKGITYEVTEEDYSADGYVTTKTGDTGKIVANSTATVAFTNTKTTTPPDNPPGDPEYGDLTVKKTVTGDLANKDQYFTFTITFNASGSYSYTGSKSGTIKSGDTVQLKHGESITISGLPAGTTYAVTESGNNGYRVYASGNTGTIAANATSTAAFTNARSSVPQTGDDSNLLLWLSIAGVAGMGMVLTTILGKKRTGKHIAAK